VSLQAPTVQQLEQLWTSLIGAGAGAGEPGRQRRRVLGASCHDCFVAVSFPDRHRLLSVVIDKKPPGTPVSRPLTSGMQLLYGIEPTSGRPTMDIVLREDSHSDIFTALVADLLGTLALSSRPGTSAQLLLARLEDWRRLLATVSPQGLTAEQQRGLFGELSVMRDVLLPAAGSVAVLAWTGPDRQLQDFQFPGCAVEVKTTSGNNAATVRITNERQLDHRAAGQLFLVTLALDARREGSGLALPDLVEDLHREIRPLGMAADFEQRLTMSGYLQTQAHLYADRHYTVRQRLIHTVDEKFPKITEEDLPDGLSDVSYTLDLHAASAFRTSEPEMIRSLGLTP
jgi:Putative  PD-(D/E)XK family member, (DUF4420)